MKTIEELEREWKAAEAAFVEAKKARLAAYLAWQAAKLKVEWIPTTKRVFNAATGRFETVKLPKL